MLFWITLKIGSSFKASSVLVFGRYLNRLVIVQNWTYLLETFFVESKIRLLASLGLKYVFLKNY